MKDQQEIRDLYIIETNTKNELGNGQYGTVYKCKRKDGLDNDSLCVKISQKNRNLMKQLKQEIEVQKLITNLKTEKLIRIENVINLPHQLEIIMERCDMDLEQEFKNLIQQNKWYNLNDCLSIVKQIAEGCRILYEHSIVHRDIKPSNILVKLQNIGKVNERKVYKLSDFGFSRILRSFEVSKENTNVGTPCYTSPQISKQQDYSGKCDIYSYGILFYQIFFQGKLPFTLIKGREDIMLFQKKLEDKQFKCKLPKYSRALEIADLLQKMLVYGEEERISFDQFFLHPIINLEEYEIYKIQQVQFRKYLLYNSICQQYQDQQKEIFQMASLFCLYLLGNQELIYCLGFIHNIISDIHPSYIKNKDIVTIQNILRQCDQNINIHPQYQKLTKRIKQEYFQMKKQIINLSIEYLMNFDIIQDSNQITQEITTILEQSQSERIKPQRIIDLLRSLLDQKLQEDLKGDILKVLNYQEQFPFEKYKEINPDDIFKEEQNQMIQFDDN